MTGIIKILIFVLFFQLFYGCTAVNQCKDCDDFTIGEFRYKEQPFDKTTVFRDSIYQVEVDTERNITYKLKIDWLNKNEYNLTLLSSSDSIQNLNIGQVLNVKIIKRYKKYYTCLAQINGNKLNLTMVKIR